VQQRAADAPGRPLVIAIDGPSGSGKSTVARGVARALGIGYLDTGAMYRAVTWLALSRGVDLDDTAALTRLAADAELIVSSDPDEHRVEVDGLDVTREIREAEVTRAVSLVSAVPGVREALVVRQRAIIAAGPVAVEGRDIGTTVAPDAAVKVFLHADPEVRAQRRASQLNLDVHDVLAKQRVRDERDNTEGRSTLEAPPGSDQVDTTNLTLDEVVDAIAALAEAKR
jgi:CMP/dCMP kinase